MFNLIIRWLRTQISLELLRSVHICVRGSLSKIEHSLDCKKKKRHHCRHLKFLGNFQAKRLPCIIDHASFAEHQMMVYSNPNNKPIDGSRKQGGKDLFADLHSEFGVQHSVLGILQK